MIKRVVIIVLDSLGLGALPDAEKYGDAGAHTLGHIDRKLAGIKLPNLAALGLGNIDDFVGIKPVATPMGCYGKLAITSWGKDTNIGHWELAGLVQTKPFPTYPDGFPAEVIEAFSRAIGRSVLGNIPASGTEIIEELGAEHLRTGYPIVYTSADSVFQIAAHEELVPPTELYRICRIARQLLVSPHNVLRVIARPFIGQPGSFKRTAGRRDFALPPPGDTLLDRLHKAEIKVTGIGKIGDIFSQRGISESRHTESNQDGMQKIIGALKQLKTGMIFANLVDFDMLYGHRNDVAGYARALQEFDEWLPRLINNLGEQDLLIITSDHGCDPTTPGTDHTREYALLLVYGAGIKSGVDLGTGGSLADVGQSVAEALGISPLGNGESFWRRLVASD